MANLISSLRQQAKTRYNAISNNNLQKDILNAIPYWIGAIITGVVAVIYAKLFLYAEKASAYLFHQASWSFFILTPITFLVAWLVAGSEVCTFL